MNPSHKNFADTSRRPAYRGRRSLPEGINWQRTDHRACCSKDVPSFLAPGGQLVETVAGAAAILAPAAVVIARVGAEAGAGPAVVARAAWAGAGGGGAAMVAPAVVAPAGAGAGPAVVARAARVEGAVVVAGGAGAVAVAPAKVVKRR